MRPGRGADPGGRSSRADGAADAALAASEQTMPARFRFPAARSTRPMPRRMDAALREAEEEVGLKRRIRRADRLSRSLRHRVRLPHPADGGAGAPGFKLHINESEVVDAFEVPLAFLMNPENHQIHMQGIPRHGALATMRCRSRSATSGARPPESCAYCTSGSTSHDPSGPDRNRNLPDPLCGLCGVPGGDALRRALCSHPGRLHLVAKLVLGSLLLVIVSFLFLAEFSGAPPDSTYVPAHMEDGHLVPGVEKPGATK